MKNKRRFIKHQVDRVLQSALLIKSLQKKWTASSQNKQRYHIKSFSNFICELNLHIFFRSTSFFFVAKPLETKFLLSLCIFPLGFANEESRRGTMELEAKSNVVWSWEEIFREGERIFAESDRTGAAKSSSNSMIKERFSWIIQAKLVIQCNTFLSSPYRSTDNILKSQQELKQSQLDEHAKLLKEIEIERLKLQEEKARLEIAKKLNSNNADDSVLSRAEVDAAIKYAEVNKSLWRFFAWTNLRNRRAVGLSLSSDCDRWLWLSKLSDNPLESSQDILSSKFFN